MAKSRSKSAGRASGSRKKKAAKKTSRRSALRMDGGDAPIRTLKAGDVPDDIELLNVHRYPESMPASVVAFVRNDRNCQRRLEELVKGTPGKRGQSGFNQLFQQKLDESSDSSGPPPTVLRADDRKGDSADGSPGNSAPGGPPPANRQAAPGGIGGFFRKLFS